MFIDRILFCRLKYNIFVCFFCLKPAEIDDHGNIYTHINAFQLIGMSSCLDLSGFFEKEVRNIRLCFYFVFCYHSYVSFDSVDDHRMFLKEWSDSHQNIHQQNCLRGLRTLSPKWDFTSREDMEK